MTDTLELERSEMLATLERIRKESNDPLIGKVLNGGHKIIRPLGAGGMGTVYLAYDFDLGQKVVVKILQPQFADEQTLKERFQQEAQLLVGLRHPAIPAVNYIDKSGPWFLVMEFCEGDSLADYLHHNQERRMNRSFQRQLLEPFFGIIDALALAHSKGIIHRDIKPENIMVHQTGTGELIMKLIDFGIAKASRKPAQTIEGSILGTLGYLSPEQLMGRTITKLSDVYSLGAVLFEIFAGQEFIIQSNNMIEMTGKTMNLLYVQERLKLLPVHIRALVGLMLEMQAKDRLGGMYEVEGGLKYVRSIMEIEEDGGQIDGNELDISMELTSSKKVDGNLEILGVQRVMKRQLEVRRNNVMVTAQVPAIQEAQGAPAFQPPASGLPSMDVSISSLLGPPVVSNPDYRVSDLGVQAGAKPSMAAQPAVSVHAEPGAGTMLGVGGRPSGQISAVSVPSQEGHSPSYVPAVKAVTLLATEEPRVSAEDQTVEAPLAQTSDEKKTKKFSRIMVAAGIIVGVLLLTLSGFLLWNAGRKKGATQQKTPSAQARQGHEDHGGQAQGDQPGKDAGAHISDRVLQADAATTVQRHQPGPDAAAVIIPPDASVQYDASTAPPEQSVEDTYKVLEETCRTTEKGQKFWIVPNFRLYCLKTEIFKIADLDKKLKLLRYNKNKYCRPGLRIWERGKPEECRSHEHWIRDTVDKIWARDHPNWRPSPRKPPGKPSKKPSPRSKPKPRR